jgi:hypothetical protein
MDISDHYLKRMPMGFFKHQVLQMLHLKKKLEQARKREIHGISTTKGPPNPGRFL